MDANDGIRQLDSLLKRHAVRKDDVAALVRQDDVDSLLNYLTANNIRPEQYENCYDQGLLHLAGIRFLFPFHHVAQYDAVNILNSLLHQSGDLLKEDAVRFSPNSFP